MSILTEELQRATGWDWVPDPSRPEPEACIYVQPQGTICRAHRSEDGQVTMRIFLTGDTTGGFAEAVAGSVDTLGGAVQDAIRNYLEQNQMHAARAKYDEAVEEGEIARRLRKHPKLLDRAKRALDAMMSGQITQAQFEQRIGELLASAEPRSLARRTPAPPQQQSGGINLVIPVNFVGKRRR